jgi:hypothetical protein
MKDKNPELVSMIFQALGQASMCWSETPKGIFDSTKAQEIGENLVNDITNHLKKSLLVLYSPVFSDVDEGGLDSVMKMLSDQYRILILEHESIQTPQVVMFNAAQEITPLQLDELQKEFIKKMNELK